jgi:hypothetical protein
MRPAGNFTRVGSLLAGVLATLLALATVAACEPSRVEGAAGKDAGPVAAGGDARGGPDDGGGQDAFTVTGPEDAGDAAPAEPTCAGESHRAQPVPLDVLLLLDRSGSMSRVIPGAGRKWDMVRQAIFAFIGSTSAAGLGVGLQLVPNVTPALTCTADADCRTTPASGICHPDSVCVLDGRALSTTIACDPGGCPGGGVCRRRGICAGSARDCFDLGAPCAGGPADDLCMPRPRTCGTRMACDGPAYVTPVVGIAALPGGAAALKERLRLTDPLGATPLGSAVQGALAHLGAHLAAHPDRRAALVLASDGLPTACGPGVDAIRDLLAAARAGPPAITSYVIGVSGQADGAGAPRALDSLAAAGGSGKAFILEPDTQLSERLFAALDQIRSAALPCAFAIPPPNSGPVDYDKVNLRFISGGAAEDVLYVSHPDRCDATRGGWYYEGAPGPARRVVVCEASCRRFQADPAAQVDLRFGCRTRVIE